MQSGTELIIGAVLPPVIDFLNRYIKNATFRYVGSLVICLIIGTLLNLSSLSLEDILKSGAVVFAAAQTVYKTYWQGSDLR